jgi:hypothetical protein
MHLLVGQAESKIDSLVEALETGYRSGSNRATRQNTNGIEKLSPISQKSPGKGATSHPATCHNCHAF